VRHPPQGSDKWINKCEPLLNADESAKECEASVAPTELIQREISYLKDYNFQVKPIPIPVASCLTAL